MQQRADTNPRESFSGLWIWWLPLCTQTVSITTQWADKPPSLGKQTNKAGQSYWNCEMRESCHFHFYIHMTSVYNVGYKYDVYITHYYFNVWSLMHAVVLNNCVSASSGSSCIYHYIKMFTDGTLKFGDETKTWTSTGTYIPFVCIRPWFHLHSVLERH